MSLLRPGEREPVFIPQAQLRAAWRNNKIEVEAGRSLRILLPMICNMRVEVSDKLSRDGEMVR